MLRNDLIITTKEVKDRDDTKTIYILANLYSSTTKDFPAKIKIREGKPITDEQISLGLFTFNVIVFTQAKTIIHRRTYKLFASEITLPEEVPRELQAIFGTSMVEEGSMTYIPNPSTWNVAAIRVFCELESVTMPQMNDHQADINNLIRLKTGKMPSNKPTTPIKLDIVQLFLEESAQIRASLKAELTDITVAPNVTINATEESTTDDPGAAEKVMEAARIARGKIIKQYNRLIHEGTSFLKPFRQWLHPAFLDNTYHVPLQMIVYKHLISKVISEQGDQQRDCITALRSKILSSQLQLDEEAKAEIETQLSGFVTYVKLCVELATLYLNTNIVSDLIELSSEENSKKSRPLEIATCICKPFSKAWLKLAKYHRRTGSVSKAFNVITLCVDLLETYDHEPEALKRKILSEHKSILQQLSDSTSAPLSLPREEVIQE